MANEEKKPREHKTYKALRDAWLSHECRVAKAGETFTTIFPEGMKLGDVFEEVVKPKKPDDGKSLAG